MAGMQISSLSPEQINPTGVIVPEEREADPALAAHIPDWLNIAEFSFIVPTCLLSLLSSGVVLVVIYRTPKLHRTPGYLMAILSTVDIVLAVFDQGNNIIRLGDIIFNLDITHFWILCQLQLFANIYVYGMQSTTIMMAAVDRVIAITRPLQYHCHGAKLGKILLSFLLLSWVALLPFCVITLTQATEFRWIETYTSCSAKIKDRNLIQIILNLQFLFANWIPGAVIVACYSAIAVRIKSSSEQRQKIVASSRSYTSSVSRAAAAGGGVGSGSGTNREQESNNWQQIAICKSLILITALYYISFLPFFVYQVMHYCFGVPLNATLFRTLKAFRNLGAITDGIVFYIMSNSFQAGLRGLVGSTRSRAAQNVASRQYSRQGIEKGGSKKPQLNKSDSLTTTVPNPSGNWINGSSSQTTGFRSRTFTSHV